MQQWEALVKRQIVRSCVRAFVHSCCRAVALSHCREEAHFVAAALRSTPRVCHGFREGTKGPQYKRTMMALVGPEQFCYIALLEYWRGIIHGRYTEDRRSGR